MTHEVITRDYVELSPRCGLLKKVYFFGGRCPFSNEKSCKECIKSAKDLVYIELMKDDSYCGEC